MKASKPSATHHWKPSLMTCIHFTHTHTHTHTTFIFPDSHLARLGLGIDCLFWGQRYSKVTPKQTGTQFQNTKSLKYPLRKQSVITKVNSNKNKTQSCIKVSTDDAELLPICPVENRTRWQWDICFTACLKHGRKIRLLLGIKNSTRCFNKLCQQ